MTNQTPVQAAVVQMLIAKRPALGKLPINWGLQHDGTISLDAAWNAKPSAIGEIAQELARTLRGSNAKVSEPQQSTNSQRPWRTHTVSGIAHGVRIRYQGFEYLDGHGDDGPMGGEPA
ncbi:hypothetical protein [Streptomyces arenae]|uniref:hypothetical protein n=1 Tax=Streptomyces arenae TaxID=29301 RepID=UPI00265B3184|nr:hypothetical protein [Streptomyces arenae]MCG7204007.1 hypothetical protein [Streptomyces arenae]